ncbi:MAG: hypothetical protein IPF98_24150 [Gemmatimonadetes bacterium]|nr:hypothetical protein [Gemmatimonadota bacterium]
MRRRGYLALVAIAMTACTDSAMTPTAPRANAAIADIGTASAALDRYVAMGTSISMGWASDGVVAASQYDSWPAQLSRLAGRALDQPYISGTGCRAPMAAPLASGVRISGESVLLSPALVQCAPLLPGIDLPARNVAMSTATTFEALYVTPETRNDPFYSRLYPLVHPPNTTQLHAALANRPAFASVEFGANEVLGVRDGRAIVGVTLYPVSAWSFLYSALSDTVRMKVGRGVLVGLIKDIETFPAFRRGDELWGDRAAFFRTFNVEIKRDCRGSSNLIVVPFRVPSAVAAGLTARARGLPAVEFSCAAGPPTMVDYVLDPNEVAIVNAQLAQMNLIIRQTADRVRFAHFQLEALYGMSVLKPPFSVVALMTTAAPYSPYISLDGFHPSGLGQGVLANAAASAINRRYGFGLPVTSVVASR